MKPSEVLRGAIRQIRKRGWIQNAYYQNCALNGPLCASGALRASANDGSAESVRADYYNAYRSAYTALDSKLEETSIVAFNDNSKTTRPMVLRKMGQAARTLEKEGQ